MKILIYTDNHFCEKASIVNKFGTNYTTRLENQIASINWAEDLAYKNGCQYVICAGDFFDKPNLTQDEITALRELRWAPLCAHYFLVGNHESEELDLRYSSTKALEDTNRFIISEPILLEEPGFELAFLPYIAESQKKPLDEYFKPLGNVPRILISHNDLFGIQMGPIVSRSGFDPKELEKFSTICINGHLHNGQKVTDKVINLGNLTGKDFGEDALRYSHNVALIDTDKMSIEFIENPYAFNFYKLEVLTEAALKKLTALKNNAIVSVQCIAALLAKVKETIAAQANILESRVIIKQELTTGEAVADVLDLSVDQYVKFAECCRLKLENNEILEAELAEILK